MHTHLQHLPGLPAPFAMLPVQGSTFLMGDEIGDLWEPCRPVHPVTVSSFYMGQYPVTQALWLAVMGGKNPSRFLGDDRPVERVSWDETQKFLQKLNELTQASRPEGHHYFLPTEAEWEYAARGGIDSLPGPTPALPSREGEKGWGGAGYKYAGSDRLKEVGWYDENAGGEIHPVGQKYPNQLGLYDMSGNVWELCHDWYGGQRYYEACQKSGTVSNPTGPEQGANRVLRGGSWIGNAQGCRAAARGNLAPDDRGYNLGFRLALAPQSVGRPIPAFL